MEILIFNSTQSVFNTKVYGSDETGTLTGSDSIVVAGNTVQTSTVYGGAGADTLFVGNYGTPADAQILKVNVQGFDGADSIRFGGSFVSSTMNAGAGDDTIAIQSTTGSSSSSATSFYAGTGADSVLVAQGENLTIYGDSSATDTAGGADSLEITSLTSSTVYGAAGGDTLNVTATTSVRFDLGSGY